jgi:AbrB family looped-hinge helix DNA binding protein
MHTQPKSKPLVRVKDKFQVTLPNELRIQANLAVGDLLEVGIGRGGVITLTPKSLIDRHVLEGMADLKAGRVHGPYHTAEEAVAALDKKAAAARKSKR